METAAQMATKVWRPNIMEAMQRENAQLRLDETTAQPVLAPAVFPDRAKGFPFPEVMSRHPGGSPGRLRAMELATRGLELDGTLANGAAPGTSVPRQRGGRSPSPPPQGLGPMMFQPSGVPMGVRNGPLVPAMQMISTANGRPSSPTPGAAPVMTHAPTIAWGGGYTRMSPSPSVATACRTAFGAPMATPVKARAYSPVPAVRQVPSPYVGIVGMAEPPRYSSPTPAMQAVGVPMSWMPVQPGGGPIIGGHVVHSAAPMGSPIPASPRSATRQVMPRGVVAVAGSSSRSASPTRAARQVMPRGVVAVAGSSSRSASPTPAARRSEGDALSQQLQALQQVKNMVAQQQAISNQQIASRQEDLRRETFQALCRSSPNGLSEALKRWPSPRPEDIPQVLRGNLGSTSSIGGSLTSPEAPSYACSSVQAPSHACHTVHALQHVSAACSSVASPQSLRPEQGEVSSPGMQSHAVDTGPMTARDLHARSQPSKERALSPRTSSPPQRAGFRETRRISRHGSPVRERSDGPGPAEVQAEYARCREIIAWCVSALIPRQVRELRALNKPPDIVNKIFEAVATLLGATSTTAPSIKKSLFSPSPAGQDLPAKLRGINIEHVSLAQFRKVQKLVALPEFDEEFVQGVCKNAMQLAVWCRAIGTCLARTRFHGRPESAALASSNLDTLVGRFFNEQAPPAQVAPSKAGHGPPEDFIPASPQDDALLASLPADSTLEVPPQPQPEHERRLQQTRDLPQDHTNGASQSGLTVASLAAAAVPAQQRQENAAAPEDSPVPEARSSVTIKGLIITPDVRALEQWELQQVSELEVSKPEVGSIVFHGSTDCTDLDIPSLVHLDVGEVLVYPVQGSKPAVGQGLNKCATVTMYQCWPPNGRGHLDDTKAQDRYRWKIQQMTEDKRAKFINYDCNTGIWKFQVEHF